jgi:hypothetical protein
MTMAFTVDRSDPATLRLTMGTDFLPDDAWQIHELLERSDSGTRIELDFRRVRDCADFALSLLARDILGGRVRFDLQGMSQHQERVLSYFGVDPTDDLAIADFDPI